MAKIVVGLINSYKDATSLIQELMNSGFKNDTMSLISFVQKEQMEDIPVIHSNDTRILSGKIILPIEGEGNFVVEGLLSDKMPMPQSTKEELVDLLHYIGAPEDDAIYFLSAVQRGCVWLSLCTDDMEIADQAFATMRIHELASQSNMVTKCLVRVYETPGSLFVNEHTKLFGEPNKILPDEVSNTDVDFVSEIRERKYRAFDPKKATPTSWKSYEGPDRRKIVLTYSGINRRMAH
jgi:hypothetical protein